MENAGKNLYQIEIEKLREMGRDDLFKCPICGYGVFKSPPFLLDGYPSYDICPCCKFQYGLDDYPYETLEESFTIWREKWVNNGYPWFSDYTKPPENWDGKKQLETYLKSRK